MIHKKGKRSQSSVLSVIHLDVLDVLRQSLGRPFV